MQKPFLQWQSAISPQQVFSDVVRLSEIQTDGSDAYWLEMRPAEGGRCVVVSKNRGDVTPPGFSARNRVHEYGGGAYAVFGGNVYFSNFQDQRIYHQPPSSSAARPLTPPTNKDGSLGKYASLTVSPDGKSLLFVYEKECGDKENENLLAVLDARSEKAVEPRIVARGSDFYASPVFSPSGKYVAWLQWNHPNMPWDGTELMMGKWRKDSVRDVKKVEGGKDCAICLPRFNQEDKLYYAKDRVAEDPFSPENWWNLYAWDGEVNRITCEQAEFGRPLWAFGQSTYDFLPDGRIVAVMTKEGTEHLVFVDPEDKSVSRVETGLNTYHHLKTDKEGSIFFVGASSTSVASVYAFGMESKKLDVLREGSSLEMKPEDVSLPQFITYSTGGGEQAHAFFYPPKNSGYLPMEGEKPPLLVVAHGGPTSNTHASFSFVTQFWTSSGFAVVDVDYRGSTGYGRKYRDKLPSSWGVVDAEDVANAVKHLIKKGQVDGSRVAIRGGSAGGYLVQRMMTQYPDLFAVGASYYGIGNLITLEEQIHKFESRYIENLVGTTLSKGREVFKDRSPIYHLEALKNPMILFQGSDDKVVTPECSREVVRALEEKGVRHEYVEYEGETHGFRVKKNEVDALARESNFYHQVLGDSK